MLRPPSVWLSAAGVSWLKLTAKTSVIHLIDGHGTGRLPPLAPGKIPGEAGTRGKEGVMAKRYGRPSAQYRYEHYDPRC
jgi:hypothetical protein